MKGDVMTLGHKDRFEQLVCVVFLLFSLVSTFSMSQTGGSTINAFPLVARYIFVIWLGVASFVTLWGMWRARLAIGVLTERAGLLMLGSLFVIYATWAVVLFGGRSFGFSLLLVGLAVASYSRVWDIERARRDVRNGR